MRLYAVVDDDHPGVAVPPKDDSEPLYVRRVQVELDRRNQRAEAD
jgi:hypothetical protein